MNAGWSVARPFTASSFQSRRLPRLLTAGIAGAVGVWICGLSMAAAQESALPPPPAIAPSPTSGDSQGAASITVGLLQDRPIGQLQANIALPVPSGPENRARLALQEAGVQPQPLGLGRGWCLQPLAWDASAVRHRPTYFEEPNLERLGYYYGCPADGPLGCAVFGDEPRPQLLQPIVSAANFYGRAAAIPYMVGAMPPWEEVYSLGEDRPGSPVPYRKHYVPLSLRGILYQGGAVTGLAYIIP